MKTKDLHQSELPTAFDSGETLDISAALKARIRGGEFSAGQKLLEKELSLEFDVGRGRIREVFRTLVGEGYLEFIANRGVFVRRYSKHELLDIGRAREVLEGVTARMAAEKPLTQMQRQQLQSFQDEMDLAEEEGNFEAYHQGNQRFHALIEQLAGNATVAEMLTRVRIPLIVLRLPQHVNTESVIRSNRGHRFITFAILSNSPDAAEAAMRSHVQMGNEHVASLPDELFDGRGVDKAG